VPEATTADHVIIKKSDHTLTVMDGIAAIKTYQVALGRGGSGPKMHQGDNKVPEGNYRIVSRNAHSHFHLSLKISYPEPRDIEEARRNNRPPGGDIMIHGIRNGMGWVGSFHRLVDWTAGCVAVTDQEMDEIWRIVPDGTPVDIEP